MVVSADLPDLRSLELFHDVLRRGSISAAARRHGITQQAASTRLRSLEAQVGAVLLVRGPRGTTATPAGIVLTEWVGRLLDVAGQVQLSVASLREDHRGELAVAASMTVAEHLMPGWLVALRARQAAGDRPPTTVTLRPTNSAHVLAEVRSGTAQLGFVEGAQAPVDLPWQAVAHDELVAVVAPGHPWARRRGRLRAADLVAEPLVCREVGSGTRQVLDEALRAQGHPPVTPLLELGTATAVREAVRAGGAAAVLSRLAVADDLAGHRLIALDVEDLDLRRTLRAVWVSGHQPPQGPARDLLALTTRRPHHPRRTPASTV